MIILLLHWFIVLYIHYGIYLPSIIVAYITLYNTYSLYIQPSLSLSNQSLPLISFRVILSRDSVLFLHLSVLFFSFLLLLFIQSTGSLLLFRPTTILQSSIDYPDTPNTIQNVLQSRRTILRLQMSLLRALHRPLLCLWTARPSSTRKDCPRWLYL